jgi:hypothetical protein
MRRYSPPSEDRIVVVFGHENNPLPDSPGNRAAPSRKAWNSILGQAKRAQMGAISGRQSHFQFIDYLVNWKLPVDAGYRQYGRTCRK